MTEEKSSSLQFHLRWGWPSDIVTLSGEVDASNADELTAVLDQLGHGAKIDCRDVSLIDWTAGKELLRTCERLDGIGQQVRLLNPQPDVDWFLQVAGLGHMLDARRVRVGGYKPLRVYSTTARI